MLGSKKTDGADLLPALTEDEAKEMMGKMLVKLHAISVRMARASESIQQQIQAAGQQMEERMVRQQYVLPALTAEFKKAQEEVLDEFDVDESELEEANAEYMKNGHKELINITNKIRSIYNEFGGEIGLEGTDGDLGASPSSARVAPAAAAVPSEKLEELAIKLLTVLSEKMLENTERYIVQFKGEYGVPKTAGDFERFQQGLMVITEGVEKQLLEDNGLTQTDFQELLMRQQNNETIQKIFMQMQYRNQMILQAHGIAMQYA